MASMLEAIEIKRKMYFEFENAPYHCLDVEVSKPTARGGQTLVRIKMRNLLTRAVFDKTFKAGEKFREPDLDFDRRVVSLRRRRRLPFHGPDQLRDPDAGCRDCRRRPSAAGQQPGGPDSAATTAARSACSFPPHVELTVTSTEPGVRGDTASGGVTKPAMLETGLEIRVPLFIKEGEKVKVHTETREFAGRA